MLKLSIQCLIHDSKIAISSHQRENLNFIFLTLNFPPSVHPLNISRTHSKKHSTLMRNVGAADDGEKKLFLNDFANCFPCERELSKCESCVPFCAEYFIHSSSIFPLD